MKRIAMIGGSQYRSAGVQDPAHIDGSEQAAFLDVQKTAKAFLDTDALPTERVRRSDRGPDHGVEAGTVAPSRKNTDAFLPFHEVARKRSMT